MKRDLKINFYILEEIVYEIQKYSTALEEMERASSSVINLLEMNESQGIEELEKLYRGFEKELKKCREELQDLRTILASYTNEMQSIIRPNNQQNFMRVDRNDIWFNKEAIIYACDNINDALKDHNLGWDEFSFGKSDEKKAREERNYRKLEDIWEYVIPRFSRKLSAQIDGLDHVYKRKIIPFENKDDEYKYKATRLYDKYTNLWEGIRTDITDDITMLADLVHGVFDAIIDLIAGIAGLAWGVISYSAAVDVLAVTYPLNIQPKWAEEVFNGTNSVVGSILSDPMLVVEGFAQQASDAFEEEGAAYALGYVAGDFLGGKGLGKLAKVGKVKVLGAAANAIELGSTLKFATTFDDALIAVEKAVIKGAPDSEIYDLMENAVANKSWSVGEAKLLQTKIAEKSEWIGKYYNCDMSPIWPPNDGFVGALHTETLQPGIKLDRYGYPTGRFGSPVDTPYESRALLPGTKEITPYNIYELVEPLELEVGEIAPWFGKPGGGIQYVLKDGQTFKDLLEAGIIRKVD